MTKTKIYAADIAAAELCFPEKVLEQHAIWLGKTRAGKSSSMRHVVEWLLARGQRLCIVDPKGDWYGLKLSADGKSAGFPVILFGDFKEATASDVAINDRSGKAIAELIATGNRPCVIGMRGWSNAAQSRFWIDFASTLFNSNLAGGLKLFVDECQNFAPKERTGIGQENEALGWTKRLLSEGSGLGLTIFCGSQRPASVHNGVLTQCETLVAMRVIHGSDRKASQDWIKGCGDEKSGDEVLKSLADLKRGEAFMWSPEAEFGPERIQFPMFRTFDSFAPPQLQKKISEAGWANVDLQAVQEKLATVIEEQKANDPKELKAEIARLKSESKRRESESQKTFVAPPAAIKEVPVLTAEERGRLESLVAAFAAQSDRFNHLVGALKELEPSLAAGLAEAHFFKAILESKLTALPLRARSKESVVLLTANRAPAVRRPVPTFQKSEARSHEQAGRLPIGERKVLEACIQFPGGVSRQQLTVLTGFKRSTRDAYIQRLREKNMVVCEYESVSATEDGIAALPDAQPLPTGEELQQYWLNKLPQGEGMILGILIENYPNAVTRDLITETTGFKRSTRDAYLQRMSAKMLFTEPSRGEVRASETLFA